MKSQTPISIHIDTSRNDLIRVGITLEDKTHWLEEAITSKKAQRVLPLLYALLKQNNVSWDDIEKVDVNPGPGSFTGLRVGFSVANTIEYLLGIPSSQLGPDYTYTRKI